VLFWAFLPPFANALGVSLTVFLEFNIETASDVLSLLFKMDEQVDMELDGDKDEDGNLIPGTICLRFKHPEINNRPLPNSPKQSGYRKIYMLRKMHFHPKKHFKPKWKK
jgi:hypothetical protein